MEEQEDGAPTMESRSESSWIAMEGSLEQSVKVVEESEDAVYTAGPTSRLVLVPPSSSSLPSSTSSPEPCELTVTFQERHGHIHQIYVLSTARICEIYGQKEQDGEQEYVCTVRGGIISLADDELADNASELSPSAVPKEDLTNADNISNTASVVPLAIAELDSPAVVQQQISPSEGCAEELVAAGQMDLSQKLDESQSLPRRCAEEELFSSFTEAISGRIVDGSIIFEEGLDQADWVECPHSPMKSNSSISDDDAEVDISKSGFYFIDADLESHHAEHSQLPFFTHEHSNPGKSSSNLSLTGGDTESSGHSSWQEAIEDDPTLLKTTITDVPLPPRSTTEQNFEEERVQEPSDSPEAQLDQNENECTGEDLPRAGFCVFEVIGERGSSSSAIASSTLQNVIKETHEVGTDQAKSRRLETSGDMDGDTESRSMVEPSVYECEVSLVNADAWTSLTIRLLSMKTKRQVQIHRVVITYTPGPPIQLPLTVPSAPVQQGVGTSSLLAMLVPGILQMARGLSEPRKVKNSAISGTGGMVSEVKADISAAPSQKSVADGEVVSADAKVSTINYVPHTVDQSLNCGVEDKPFYHGNVEGGDFRGTPPLESATVGGTQVSTGHGGESESVLHQLEPPKIVEFKESRKVEQIDKKGEVLSESSREEDDRVGELVQRLDRLESICLRMESKLNAVLENMDNRLKVLESGGLERMSTALGHPIWGPGFDSGSFVSATSVHLPTVQTGTGKASAMDSRAPFSISSAADVPVGDSTAKCLSSREPCYSCMLSSTSPSLIPPLSSALPVWPLSSWPQNVSPDSSSHSSGVTASFIAKSSLMNQSNGSLHDSEQPSNGGETYWESRTSDDSETDISSGSERTSYADNCEDPGCGCCPESVPSSLVKPGQLVDNALASALSAFSASFEAQKREFSKEDGVYDGEENSDEEDSFTSEEQVPLVELDFFTTYCEKEANDTNAVKEFMYGYEAIPLSSDRDIGDLNVSKAIQGDNLWPPENEENQQVKLPDEGLQKEEKTSQAVEDFTQQAEVSKTAFEVDEICTDDSATRAVQPADLEGDLLNITAKESEGGVGGGDAEAVLESHRLDLQQNPFLQELASGGGEDSLGAQSAWLEQGWTEKQAETAKNVMSSYLTVRGFSKPLASHEEMVLQEGLFPDEWNWFTSEFSPFASLVEVRDSSEDTPAGKDPLAPLMETMLILEENSSKIAPAQVEPWSLLDDDASRPNTTQQFCGDINGKDWHGQKSHWSLLDEYPLHRSSRDNHADEGSLDGCGQNGEPRSLFHEDISLPAGELHEDISLPAGEVPAVEQEADLYSSSAFLEDNMSLFGAIQSSKYTDMSHSPSSQASRSNPFEDECDERLDLSQGSNNEPLVLLEEFGEDVHQVGPAVPERTTSLLFHLSL